MSLIIDVLIAICFIASTRSQICDVPDSCVGEALSSNTDFDINGYKAAIGPTTSFSGQMSDALLCEGALSCQSMSFITERAVKCKATQSCSNTSIVARDNIKCYGSQSCTSSILRTTTPSSTNDILCDGEQSCANSRIYPARALEATGTHSLYFATIYSNSQNNLTLQLRAELAGYGGTLTCDSGHTCHIHCDGHTSCYMFFIDCIGTCHIYADGTMEPTTNITQFTQINDISRSTIATEALCNTHPNARTYDSYREQADADIVTPSDNPGPICCRAHSACEASKINCAQGEDVICSGGFGCKDATIDANNGSVFCEAADACHSSHLHNIASLYCRGLISCQSSTVISSRYITCSGEDSCDGSTIYSAGTDLDLYLTGLKAAFRATIYCNETDWCNIMCNGYKSCSETVLHCSGTCNVYCDESSQCPVGWTSSPTEEPTANPTLYTSMPSEAPSIDPTETPTLHPSSGPTLRPSPSPSYIPSSAPSAHLDEAEVPDTMTTSITWTKSTESSVNTTVMSTWEIIAVIVVSAVALACAVCVTCAVFTFHTRRKGDNVQANMVHTMTDQADTIPKGHSQNITAQSTHIAPTNTIITELVVAGSVKVTKRSEDVGAIEVQDKDDSSSNDDLYEVQKSPTQTTTKAAGGGEENHEDDGEELYEQHTTPQTEGNSDVTSGARIQTQTGCDQHEQCVYCLQVKLCTLFEANGLFYCDDCWKQYTPQ
eukprot:1091210_1